MLSKVLSGDNAMLCPEEVAVLNFCQLPSQFATEIIKLCYAVSFDLSNPE